MNRPYEKFFNRIMKSKQQYQESVLNSSIDNKFSVLKRLQEKGLFFKKVRYKFSESFSFKKIVDILNDLVLHNTINNYAIGGATALLFYSTPQLTEDIDVFITLDKKGLLFSLSDIYKFLKKNYNAVEEREYLLIDGNPIQFLIPGDELTQEAFDNARELKYLDFSFKIFTFEYLIAIMLMLNKSKYRERLVTIKSENKYNEAELMNILNKYSLQDKWNKIEVEI